MSTLRIESVVKAYGDVVALSGVDMAVTSGTVTAILGPSGSGKTTLLRCIAGFEAIDHGQIHVDAVTVASPNTHLPAHRRRIAIVPQEGALFPNLTVAGNVAYGLDRSARRSRRVDELLDLLGLAGQGDRMPHELSGGQQQRVAVARALAPRPSLILFDEPFSALDSSLRTEIRVDIREALRSDHATGVLVTHDQTEALTIADQVCVMRDGTVVQADTPADVYRRPATPWVAESLGEASLLDGTAQGRAVDTLLGLLPCLVEPTNGAVTVLVRPEQVVVGPADMDGSVPARVLARSFRGPDTMLTLVVSDRTVIRARVTSQAERFDVGDVVGVRVEGTVHTWPRTGTPRPRADHPVLDEQVDVMGGISSHRSDG